MNRRQLFAAAAALVAALALSACQDESAAPGRAGQGGVSTQTFAWKMVTSWPKDYPGLGSGAEGFARRVEAMSGGRLRIQVYAAGELVPALEVFEAVSRGSAELGHSTPYYWKGKVPAAQFFTAVPFGLSTTEMNAWLQQGGGMALWQEAYAPHGIKPLVAGNTTMQMGGWFNKEINSLDDLQGLKIRIPGLGAEVYNRLGATTVNMPGGEVAAAMQNGAIDATDWVGPYNDLASAIHKTARYYYYPGWQEPQAVIELMVNQKAWDALPADLQAIVGEAARGTTQLMIEEFVYHNAQALIELKRQGVQLRHFPDPVLAAMRYESEQVLDQLARRNDLNGRIWASMKAFRAEVGELHELSEKELYNWR